MKIETFFSELKRRNVYKAAVAYPVVAWLLGFEKNLALIQTMFREK